MPWRNSPDDRRRSDATYDATYRRNRTVAMRRDGWRCQLRLDGCRTTASTCDHITPISQGGTNALPNLRAVCQPCHDKKTAGEGGGYRQPGQAHDPAPVTRTTW